MDFRRFFLWSQIPDCGLRRLDEFTIISRKVVVYYFANSRRRHVGWGLQVVGVGYWISIFYRKDLRDVFELHTGWIAFQSYAPDVFLEFEEFFDIARRKYGSFLTFLTVLDVEGTGYCNFQTFRIILKRLGYSRPCYKLFLYLDFKRQRKINLQKLQFLDMWDVAETDTSNVALESGINKKKQHDGAKHVEEWQVHSGTSSGEVTDRLLYKNQSEKRIAIEQARETAENFDPSRPQAPTSPTLGHPAISSAAFARSNYGAKQEHGLGAKQERRPSTTGKSYETVLRENLKKREIKDKKKWRQQQPLHSPVKYVGDGKLSPMAKTYSAGEWNNRTRLERHIKKPVYRDPVIGRLNDTLTNVLQKFKKKH